MTFKHDSIFNASHKMGNASISYDKAMIKFGEGDTESGDGKSSNSWDGSFTAADGTTIRASFWDWKNGLKNGKGVSVWVSDSDYLDEFIQFIQA